MPAAGEIRMNAWTGAEAASAIVDEETTAWGLAELPGSHQWLRAIEPPAALSDWEDPSVGWGVVMADASPGLSDSDRANAVDAPDAVRELINSRANAVVLRYRADLGPTKLRRYYADAQAHDVAVGVGFTQSGTGRGQIPRYLLIFGGPEAVPWSVQYELNRSYFVGRIALTGTGLENYVGALIENFRNAESDPTAVAVWATDHGGGDISGDMRQTIAQPVITAVEANPALSADILTASDATADKLMAALGKNPSLVVTTSHGLTSPLNDSAKMKDNLGTPVDQHHNVVVTLSELETVSAPGAIWYCHACCSAGSDAGTSYDGLLDTSSSAGRVTHAVGELGPTVSPLPQALLSGPKPIRGFIGQVEPTFDWTLADQLTGQPLTSSIRSALYDHYLGGIPIGLGFDDYYRGVGDLYSQHAQAKREYNNGVLTARVSALRLRLTAIDRQSMVLLGDPTATCP